MAYLCHRVTLKTHLTSHEVQKWTKNISNIHWHIHLPYSLTAPGLMGQMKAKVMVAQSCPTLCDPMEFSRPDVGR